MSLVFEPFRIGPLEADVSHHHTARPGSRSGALPILLLTAVLLTVSPMSAWAQHEDGEHARAYDLVRQAIALIVNTPGDHEAIEHKIDDALAAEDTSQVNLPLVEQAMEAMEAEDMHEARRQLEASIGARVHTGRSDPVPIGSPAPVTGEATGTVAAVDAIPGRPGLTSGDWILLAVSALAGLAGVVLSARLRPHLPHPPTASAR